MALTDDDVREILRLIDENELDELRIETGEFKLHVVRGAAMAPAAQPAPTPDADPETIAAPMPGTFYRAEGPGMDPFVDVGARVEPDTIVGIVEIMKMMNSVSAGVAGTIVEVCAEDAQLVKEGAPLFRVQS
jgi:acetyl-CoA carboxylase biotin carboxyl carrier protein